MRSRKEIEANAAKVRLRIEHAQHPEHVLTRWRADRPFEELRIGRSLWHGRCSCGQYTNYELHPALHRTITTEWHQHVRDTVRDAEQAEGDYAAQA
jgi:hypothetical protein